MSATIRSDPLLSLIEELLRLRSRFEMLFENVHDDSSLSTLQMLIMFSVFEAPTPPTVPQVGRNLGHPRQVIQRAANELVEAGILQTAPNPHHKRAKLLVPTAKAHKMKREAEERAIEIAGSVLDKISARRCSTLTKDLRALRQDIDKHISLDDEFSPANDQSLSPIGALIYLERRGQR